MFDILKKLKIKDPECIYLHFSIKGIGASLLESNKIITDLTSFFGPNCTLFAPTYPHGKIPEYISYLSQPIIKYDTDLTPCKLNLFGEIFRRRKNSVRSKSPIIPISGIGPLAYEILENSHLDENPFGVNSSYQKLTQYKTYVLAIGLDSHTNLFIHEADEYLKNKIPYELYSKEKVKAQVYANKEFLFEREYQYLMPEIRRKERPERLHNLMVNENFYNYVSQPFNAYSLELTPFLDFATKIGRESLESGDLPIWHKPLINI